jgi:hypothetical protein
MHVSATLISSLPIFITYTNGFCLNIHVHGVQDFAVMYQSLLFVITNGSSNEHGEEPVLRSVLRSRPLPMKYLYVCMYALCMYISFMYVYFIYVYCLCVLFLLCTGVLIVLSPTRKETNYSDRRFWVSYILFIIIIGGILVLFIQGVSRL